MTSLKYSAQESIILLGSPGQDSVGSALADFCEVYSRQGDVKIGISGDDMLEPRPPGTWQKIENYFKKNTSTANLQEVKMPVNDETVRSTVVPFPRPQIEDVLMPRGRQSSKEKAMLQS